MEKDGGALLARPHAKRRNVGTTWQNNTLHYGIYVEQYGGQIWFLNAGRDVQNVI